MLSAVIDTLESRTLFAVAAISVLDGVVRIVGGEGAEHVLFQVNAIDPTKLDMTLNDQVTQFNLPLMKGIQFDGGGGDDICEINRFNGDFYLPATLGGGDGNDTLNAVYSAPVKVSGGAGDDLITTYSSKRCTVYGDAGNDTITMIRNERDLACGGAGDDSITASGILDGGDGNDTMAGAGLLIGGIGNDRISSWSHTGSTLHGGAGSDYIIGDSGDDQLFGEDGNDILWGGNGNDVLIGGKGDDALHGGEGNDDLDGGIGNDILIGNTGNDDRFGVDADQTLADNKREDAGLNDLSSGLA